MVPPAFWNITESLKIMFLNNILDPNHNLHLCMSRVRPILCSLYVHGLPLWGIEGGVHILALLHSLVKPRVDNYN